MFEEQQQSKISHGVMILVSIKNDLFFQTVSHKILETLVTKISFYFQKI